ncbi:interleukin-15 isoform X2 [Pseudorasbora parva]|uniref:interleukin-15 isoform X2 n=1 Tax=Pseudorasbora parva TaxID=51549 RepID=UPI00351EEDCC
MILMTLFLAFIVGFWNRPPKLKAKRTGRCVCNPWCNEIRMECLLNSEVWNSILILSCLSALLPMAEGHAMQVLRDLQNALNETEDLFSKSDARLYTPNIDHINVCTNTFFDCFLMEMNVLLHEEDPTNPKMVEIQRTLDHYTSMNIGPRVWRKRGEEHNQRCLRSSVKFTASDGLGCRVIGWCWSTLYSEVQDFIFQQDLAPAHNAKATSTWFKDHWNPCS